MGAGALRLGTEPWLQSLNERIRNYPYATGAILLLVPSLIFAGVLRNGFVYDDGRQLLENPFVRNPRLWREIFVGSVWSFLGAAAQANFYRPLHIFSYWLICRLAGPDPSSFHLFQWLLYGATSLLVYRVGRELLQSEVAAFVGALLWSLHPLHVEAVAWIAALPEVGSGLFYLLAFWLFLRAERADRRRGARHALAAIAYLPALFYKEMALSLPLLLLAYWFFLPARDSWRVRALHWIPYTAGAAAYGIIRVVVLGHFSDSPHFWKVSPQIAAAALGLLGQHTRLFFWPTHLNVFRTFDVGSGLRSPWPWLTLLVLLGAWGGRRREPVVGFLVTWWAVTLLPCLDARQLSFPLLAERFSYLPSVGLCLVIAFSCLRGCERGVFGSELAVAVVSGLALVMFLWGVEDRRAIPNWNNNDTLWNYSLQVSPNAALVHVNRGLVLQFRQHDHEGAAHEFETALRLNRASFMPLPVVTYDSYIGLGQISYAKGRETEALRYFKKAVQELPRHSLAYDVLGSVYFPRGEYAKAAEYFSRAVEVNPYDLSARFQLGICRMKLGNYREAAEQFHASRQIDPSYAQAFEAEARALEAGGDTEGAARVRGLERDRQD